MSDQIEEENKIIIKEEQQDPKPETPTTKVPAMATETTSPERQLQEQTSKLEKMNISFNIWPPTQRTRGAVIDRLIETLSAESVLSKRYGTIPRDEADEVARRIEDEAFASASASVEGDDDGIEILQVYSKEISKRMLAAVKSRSAAASSGGETDSSVAQSTVEVVAPEAKATSSEDVSSVENQS